MLQTGLRVSELTGLNCADITLTRGPHLHCHGKGRKQRITPLTPQTAQVLRVWRQERAGNPDDPLFPTSRGGRLSRDAVAWLLAKHVATAAHVLPVACTPSDLAAHAASHRRDAPAPRGRRHHRHRALARPREHPDHTDLPARRPRPQGTRTRTHPPTDTRPGRYRPPDQLLAFLESL